MQIKVYPVFLLLFLTLGFNTAYSQKSPAKFGKIETKDLEATICPIDSNAHAYYIFDYGETTFTYMGTKVSSNSTGGDDRGFERTSTRHFRIKILDNQAFDWADIEVMLYRGGGDDEKVSSIKGITYNLENGKVVKTKFDKKDIKTEETSERWKTVKFAMPNVKEGSVIEVQYTVRSPYLYLPILYFQHTIPTLYNEYHVAIPEYLNYSETASGYYEIQKEKKHQPRDVTITQSEIVSTTEGLKKKKYSNTIRYTDNVSVFKAKDIPAFPKEKYLRTRLNYISKVKFELQSSKYPGSVTNYYSTNWEKVDKTMQEAYEGLEKTKHLTEVVDVLKKSQKKGLSLMSLGFEKVKNHFTWNDKYGKYPANTLSKSYKEKKGNVADINLNLVVLLRELGFEANPVILSTQENGIVHPAQASLNVFNYVIAMVKFEGKIYVLDATEPYSEINMLPVRCLNDKGRVISTSNEKWINLMNGDFTAVWSHDLIVGEDLNITGTIKGKLKNYAAYHKRNEIKSENGNSDSSEESDDENDEETEEEEDENANRIIKNSLVKGVDTLGATIDISYDVTETDYAETSGDLLYFSPAFDSYFDENPFKLEKREFPVEFDYKHKIQQIYSISIPENYQISELPKTLVTQLPDKSIKFIYQVRQVGDKISVMSILDIKKNLFVPEEYTGLKQIFQMMVDKQKEMVVLKKKS
jgi:hypothetical protein